MIQRQRNYTSEIILLNSSKKYNLFHFNRRGIDLGLCFTLSPSFKLSGGLHELLHLWGPAIEPNGQQCTIYSSTQTAPVSKELMTFWRSKTSLRNVAELKSGMIQWEKKGLWVWGGGGGGEAGGGGFRATFLSYVFKSYELELRGNVAFYIISLIVSTTFARQHWVNIEIKRK